jgi:hydrogenase maturation factor
MTETRDRMTESGDRMPTQRDRMTESGDPITEWRDPVTGAHCHPEEGCITCGDEAVALEVLAVDELRGLALCTDGDGRHTTVEVALVAPVQAGEALLVHAGTAIAHAPGQAAA